MSNMRVLDATEVEQVSGGCCFWGWPQPIIIIVPGWYPGGGGVLPPVPPSPDVPVPQWHGGGIYRPGRGGSFVPFPQPWMNVHGRSR